MTVDGEQMPQGESTEAPEGADTTPQGETTITPEPATGPDFKAESRKWEARAKKSDKELQDLRKKLEQMVSPEQVATTETQLAEVLARAAHLERESLRWKIAARTNLPADLAERLKGDSEEEMLADAEVLASLVKPAPSAVAAKAGSTAPTSEPVKPSITEVFKIATGKA